MHRAAPAAPTRVSKAFSTEAAKMGRDRTKKHSIAVNGAWLPVPLEFMRSRACAELSPHAAKLLLDLMALLGPNATRNGDLSLAPKAMKARGWSGRETLRMAVAELLEHGLLAQTRQGSRRDCSLYALTLYPVNCDVNKLDVGAGPGSYTTQDWRAHGEAAPTEANPAVWRRARKTVLLTSPRDKVAEIRPATGQTPLKNAAKPPTSSRHGTKPPVFEPALVPPRGTYLDKPSAGAKQQLDSTSKEATMNTQNTITADRPEVIETLVDLWAKVGIRAMALPKIGRAGTVLADKTAAGRRDRQSVAQAAQDAGITRPAPKPRPVLVARDDENSIDRSEAQDLHAWND